jgi:hypothetical protein
VSYVIIVWQTLSDGGHSIQGCWLQVLEVCVGAAEEEEREKVSGSDLRGLSPMNLSRMFRDNVEVSGDFLKTFAPSGLLELNHFVYGISNLIYAMSRRPQESDGDCTFL